MKHNCEGMKEREEKGEEKVQSCIFFKIENVTANMMETKMVEGKFFRQKL